MPLALLALTISAFAIGTTEFVIVGLIPTIASDVGVSVPTAGLLVSLYALGVAIGAPVLTALCAKMPRKQLAQRIGAKQISPQLVHKLLRLSLQETEASYSARRSQITRRLADLDGMDMTDR